MQGIQELTILNLNGQVVQEFDSGGQSQVDVNVSNLATGVYLIECKDVQGRLSTAKFMR